MNILVTGGTGFIGSHTVVELIKAGHRVVILDNLSNSKELVLGRIARVLELEGIKNADLPFYMVDIRDREGLAAMFEAEPVFDCCIHFAGLKAVGESVLKPWEYYENNVYGTLVLVDEMRKAGCKSIIFSSSATVYGVPDFSPIPETAQKHAAMHPYGATKSMLEDILTDLHTADVKNGDENPWNVVILRYFNPIGAHRSGLIGEDPSGIPNNLMPYITQVAVGRLAKLGVFGNDYQTHDGTGVRDYIHVVDLAKGHVAALKAVEEKCGVEIFNLGTGVGYSVLDVVHAFEEANGIEIPYEIKPRRPGDIDSYYSNPAKAQEVLGWKAELDLVDMCRDSWNWQKNNPKGYI